MIYAGTDYGVVMMSTTVSMTDGQYKRHLELYNKYATWDSILYHKKKSRNLCQFCENHFR
jgi:hypothetical protein